MNELFIQISVLLVLSRSWTINRQKFGYKAASLNDTKKPFHKVQHRPSKIFSLTGFNKEDRNSAFKL